MFMLTKVNVDDRDENVFNRLWTDFGMTWS